MTSLVTNNHFKSFEARNADNYARVALWHLAMMCRHLAYHNKAFASYHAIQTQAAIVKAMTWGLRARLLRHLSRTI